MNHKTEPHDVALIDETAIAALLDELDGSRSTIIRFVTDFVHDLPERCREIRQACEEHDCERVAELALSIRSSAQMIGAHRLARDAAMLQATANADDCDCEPFVSAVESTAAGTMPYLISAVYRVEDEG